MNAGFHHEVSRGLAWALSVTRWLDIVRQRKGRRLDVESLSDHMRRDLGLIGGRDAQPRDVLRD